MSDTTTAIIVDTIQQTSELIKSATSEGGGSDIITEQIVNTISAQAVVTNIDFILLVMIALVLVFYASQPWTVHDFYRPFFKHPIRAWAIELFIFVIDIFSASAIIYYIWNNRNPIGSTNRNYFISIEGLWIAAQGLKYIWSILFWRYYYRNWTLGLAFVFSVGFWIVSIVLTILFGIRQQWASFALSLAVTLLFMVMVVFTGTVFIWAMKGIRPRHALRYHDERMLESNKRPSSNVQTVTSNVQQQPQYGNKINSNNNNNVQYQPPRAQYSGSNQQQQQYRK